MVDREEIKAPNIKGLGKLIQKKAPGRPKDIGKALNKD